LKRLFGNKNWQHSSDEELMLALQEGQNEAFDELYHRYSKKMLYYFYRLLNHDEDKAQDFLQDLFIKVVERPEMFNTNKRFSSWLYTVASNMCKNEYRNPYMTGISDDEYELNAMAVNVDNLIAQIDHKVFKKHLKKALTQLEYVHRATFILRFQERLSIREISEVMECSEGTVKSRIHNCNKKLAQKLKQFHPKSALGGR
jgi:RNA polymerase sigma-70 factor (ECF subfamily)